MSKTCVALRHIRFEDLGTFAEPIRLAGFDIRYLNAVRDDLEPAYSADLVVFLGGPVGVYEDSSYPFLGQEINIAVSRLKMKRAMLGICLGAQVIARAAGARVYAGQNGKEIGWDQLHLTQEGCKSIAAAFVEQDAQMFHWHGDTFDLPDGATLLASTHSYPNQTFRINNHVLAFQCHPELDTRNIEDWLVGHAVEIANTPGADVRKIREETRQFGNALAVNARSSITKWLRFLNTYRTMCVAPSPDFRQVLEDVRHLKIAA